MPSIVLNPVFVILSFLQSVKLLLGLYCLFFAVMVSSRSDDITGFVHLSPGSFLSMRSFKNASRRFAGVCRKLWGVSRKIEGCFKGISKKFKECFREA